MRRNSALLIDFAICRDAPRRDFLERFPRFAASAAPAAICCFFDFAGIQEYFARRQLIGFVTRLLAFATKSKSGHQSARLKYRRRTWLVREMQDRQSTTRQARSTGSARKGSPKFGMAVRQQVFFAAERRPQ